MAESFDNPLEGRSPGIKVRACIGVLALAGMGLTGFLLYEALEHSALPGCGPGSGCEAVLGSAWSKVAGVPVAGPAFLLYGAIFITSLYLGPDGSPRWRRVAWIVLLFSAAAVFAAVWFLLVQLVFIGAMCKYCLAAHAIGVVLGVLIFAVAPIPWRKPETEVPYGAVRISPVVAFGVALASAVAIGVVIVTQLLAPSSTVQVKRSENRAEPVATAIDTERDTAPDTQRKRRFGEGFTVRPEQTDTTAASKPAPSRRGGRVAILDGKAEISPRDYPIYGPPDAKHVVVMMFDYTCPHCRKMHGHVKAARQRYGDQLAVVMLPVPLNATCNRIVPKTAQIHKHACALARLGHAVWRTDPSKFEQYEDWVLGPKRPPTGWQARDFAKELLGEQALADAMEDPWLSEQIERNVELYALDPGALPTLSIGSTVVRGAFQTPRQFFDLLEKETSIRPSR